MRILTACLALAALADYLLWGHSPGVSLAVLAAALWTALPLVHRTSLRPALTWILLGLPLTAYLAVEGGTLACLLLALLIPIAACALVFPERDPVRLAMLALGSLAGGWRTPFQAALRFGIPKAGRRRIPLREILLPITLTIFFGILLFFANLSLGPLTVQALRQVSDWLSVLASPARWGFWILAAAGAGALLSANSLVRACPEAPPRLEPEGNPEALARGKRIADLSLILLNLLFVFHNVTDVTYLWMGQRLPSGGDYPEFSRFAREGSYLLMFVVALAAVVLCLFFRLGTAQSASPLSRRLALLWIAQNLLVTASAGRRLAFHVEAFGLSRLRVYSWIWLALVSVGFLLLAGKILQGQTFRTLLRRNAVAAATALYLCAFLPADALTARWNVDLHRRGTSAVIDYDYLWSLDDQAIPFLLPLRRDQDPAVRTQAEGAAQACRAKLAVLNADWRSRTLVRQWVDLCLKEDGVRLSTLQPPRKDPWGR